MTRRRLVAALAAALCISVCPAWGQVAGTRVTKDSANGTTDGQVCWSDPTGKIKDCGAATLPAPSHFVRVTRTTNQSVNDTTVAVVAFTSETDDTNGYHDPTTNNSRMTVPTGLAGVYSASCTITWAADADGARDVIVQVNGNSALAIGRTKVTATTGSTITNAAGEYRLVAGDYVEASVEHSGGAALNITDAVCDMVLLGQ